jgi:hypothetical protein
MKLKEHKNYESLNEIRQLMSYREGLDMAWGTLNSDEMGTGFDEELEALSVMMSFLDGNAVVDRLANELIEDFGHDSGDDYGFLNVMNWLNRKINAEELEKALLK